VLGRVVEVAAGGWPLSAVLTTRVLAPLGMYDTGFFVANEMRHDRVAEPFPDDTIAGRGALFDPRRERAFEAGGMGLVSTIDDYARFARMLLGGGSLGKTVLVAPRTLRFMASDHIGPATGVAKQPTYMPGPGFGFGLGFAVRLETGASAFAGSVGEFNWSGVGCACARSSRRWSTTPWSSRRAGRFGVAPLRVSIASSLPCLLNPSPSRGGRPRLKARPSRTR
jgi:CubicO group peptidase (beta-lactamase class C family)